MIAPKLTTSHKARDTITSTPLSKHKFNTDHQTTTENNSNPMKGNTNNTKIHKIRQKKG